MEKGICDERHDAINKQLDTIVLRLNSHSEKIDSAEKKIVGQEKDTFRLEGAILALQGSIDKLITVVDGLQSKPLEKYEKIGMVIITIIVTAVVTHYLGGK